MRPIAAEYRRSGVVCVSSREPCKTAEQIELPFGMWTRGSPRNHVRDGGSVLHGKEHFDGDIYSTGMCPAVDMHHKARTVRGDAVCSPPLPWQLTNYCLILLLF